MPAVVAGAILGAGEEIGQELPSMGVLESAFGSRVLAQVLWVTLTLLSSKFTGATFNFSNSGSMAIAWRSYVLISVRYGRGDLCERPKQLDCWKFSIYSCTIYHYMRGASSWF